MGLGEPSDSILPPVEVSFQCGNPLPHESVMISFGAEATLDGTLSAQGALSASLTPAQHGQVPESIPDPGVHLWVSSGLYERLVPVLNEWLRTHQEPFWLDTIVPVGEAGWLSPDFENGDTQ